MATQTITIIHDDVDGSEGARMVSFSLDGQFYEIDLVEKNARKLHELLSPYIERARRARSGSVKAPKASAVRAPSLATKRGHNLAEIRAWALAEGLKVSERGRISNEIIEKYDEHVRNPAPAPAKAAPAKKTTARKTTTAAKKSTARKVTASARAASD